MSGAAGLEIVDLGTLGYDECLRLQHAVVQERIADAIPDRLLLVTHPSVITVGKSGASLDVLAPADELARRGIGVVETDRGGKTTWHGPGQLVAYPIVKLTSRDVHAYVRDLLHVVLGVLAEYGLEGELRAGQPGVWVAGRKIASLGVSVRKWVTYHGVALNVAPALSDFDLIVPCGVPGQAMTSMERELGRPVDPGEVRRRFTRRFEVVFGYRASGRSRHPEWLRVPGPRAKETAAEVATLVADLRLETVCHSARCPNLGECFGNGTATFLILGPRCSRSCAFCAVEHGRPAPLDPSEPERVATAVKELSIAHAVITSVTRDDLEDGGAGHFAETIRAIRRSSARTAVEVLVPDFGGDRRSIQTVCDAGPEVFNHNVETVRRLSRPVRPHADHQRSLDVLRYASAQGLIAKSGLMLGLGETQEEVVETLAELLRAGCRNLTLGQYLAPSRDHWPVMRQVDPDEFREWERRARAMGFEHVAAGPLVRSSYRAERFVRPPELPTAASFQGTSVS